MFEQTIGGCAGKPWTFNRSRFLCLLRPPTIVSLVLYVYIPCVVCGLLRCACMLVRRCLGSSQTVVRACVAVVSLACCVPRRCVVSVRPPVLFACVCPLALCCCCVSRTVPVHSCPRAAHAAASMQGNTHTAHSETDTRGAHLTPRLSAPSLLCAPSRAHCDRRLPRTPPVARLQHTARRR